MSPEFKVLYDLIIDVKKESKEDRKELRDALCEINKKLDAHIKEYEKDEEPPTVGVVHYITDMFTKQPLLIVFVLAALMFVDDVVELTKLVTG